MSEEERLRIAKERIEFVLKTYNVKLFGITIEDVRADWIFLESEDNVNFSMQVNNV